MELWKRLLIFTTFILFSCGIALVSAALATNHWFYAKPFLNTSSLPPQILDEFSTESSSSTGLNENIVTSGLFSGVRMLDFNLGARPTAFNVRDEIRTGDSFMSFGLWISIILFAGLAILWGIIGVIFSLINTVIVPYETITGPLGLYLWSMLAVLCTFISIIIFVVQYYTTILYNVLLKEQIHFGFSTAGTVWFDYSFWLMLSALAAFAANIFLLLLSGLETKTKYASDAKDVGVDNCVLMY